MDENLGKAPLPPPDIFFTNIETAVPSKKEGSDADTSDRKRRYLFVIVSFLLAACLIAALVTAAILAFEVNGRISTNNGAWTSANPVDSSQPTIRPTVDPEYTSEPRWTSTYSPKSLNASCNTTYLPTYTCAFGSCSNITTPSSCCSFPMTLNGNLFYGCTKASKSCIMSSSQDQTTYRNCVASSVTNDSSMGCFVTLRTWSACQDQGFVAKNVTVSLTIPSLDVPVLVQSVNNWIGFQQRINSSLDFNRSWSEYKSGFGIYNGNFWMGLEKIYQLTSSGQYRLRFELLTIDGRWISSEYDTFQLDNEQGNYTIHVAGYSGDGGDFMVDHNGKPFSTYDKYGRIITFPPPGSFPQSCASLHGGGWWYHECSTINANGIYNHTFQGCFLNEGGGCHAKYISVSRLMMKKL